MVLRGDRHEHHAAPLARSRADTVEPCISSAGSVPKPSSREPKTSWSALMRFGRGRRQFCRRFERHRQQFGTPSPSASVDTQTLLYVKDAMETTTGTRAQALPQRRHQAAPNPEAPGGGRVSRVGASETPRSGPTGDRDNRRRPHAVRPAEDGVRQIHGPCETLKTLPETASLLTPGTTFAELDRVAVAQKRQGRRAPDGRGPRPAVSIH